MTALDRFRQLAPHMAVAVYAMTPGGPVTVELIGPDGTISRFDGSTEAEVWEQIVPGLLAEPDEPEEEDDIFA